MRRHCSRAGSDRVHDTFTGRSAGEWSSHVPFIRDHQRKSAGSLKGRDWEHETKDVGASKEVDQLSNGLWLRRPCCFRVEQEHMTLVSTQQRVFFGRIVQTSSRWRGDSVERVVRAPLRRPDDLGGNQQSSRRSRQNEFDNHTTSWSNKKSHTGEMHRFNRRHTVKSPRRRIAITPPRYRQLRRNKGESLANGVRPEIRLGKGRNLPLDEGHDVDGIGRDRRAFDGRGTRTS